MGRVPEKGRTNRYSYVQKKIYYYNLMPVITQVIELIDFMANEAMYWMCECIVRYSIAGHNHTMPS